MDRRHSAEWAARVVAWHNRHPLARRLTPAQVSSLGWVVLPYDGREAAGVQPGAAGANADPTSRKRWRPLFTERFLRGLSAWRVARWSLRHGQLAAPPGKGLPVREIAADPRRAVTGAPVLLWVATAALQAGRAQTRVLLDVGPTTAVLGHRLWSAPRCAALAAMAVLTAASATVGPGLAHRHADVLADAGHRIARVAAAVSAGVASTVERDPDSDSSVDTSHEAAPELRFEAAADPASAVPARPRTRPPTVAGGADAADPSRAPSRGVAGSATAAPPGARADAAGAAFDARAAAAAAADDSGGLPALAAPAAHAAKAAQHAGEPADGATAPQGRIPAAVPLVAIARKLPPPPQPVRAGTVALPLRPALDDAAKALARVASEAARAARQGGGADATTATAAAPANERRTQPLNTANTVNAVNAPGLQPDAAAAPPATRVAPSAQTAPTAFKTPMAPAYALATPLLRSEAEAQLKQAILKSALAKAGAGVGLRVELMAAGDDWRVVCWPVQSRERAERLRALLAARGQRIELVDF